MADPRKYPWWPNEDEVAELARRASAALAEIGHDVEVTFEPSGFEWPSGLRDIEPDIERACTLAWESMQPPSNGSSGGDA